MGFDVLEFTRRKAEEEAASAATRKQSQPKYTEDEVRQMSLDLAKRKLYEETAGTVNSESMAQLLTDIQGLKVPATTGSMPKTTGGYYSRPVADVSDIQGRLKKLNSAAMAFSYPVEQAKRMAEKAATGLESASAALKSTYDIYKATPTWEAAQAYNQALSAYQSAKTDYESAYSTYQTAYDQYEKISGEADAVFSAWKKYADQSQAEYDAWKGTIRDADVVKQELDAVEARIKELEIISPGAMDIINLLGSAATYAVLGSSSLGPVPSAAVTPSPELTDLKAQRDLLKEEYDWAVHSDQIDIRNTPYFGTLSEQDRLMVIDMTEMQSWSQADQARFENWLIARRNAPADVLQWADRMGWDRLEEIESSLRRYQNQQSAQETVRKAQEAAQGGWGGFLSSLATIPAGIWNAVTAPFSVAQELLWYDDRYGNLDPNGPGFQTGIWSGAVRDTVGKNIAGDVYDAKGNQTEDGGLVRQGLATLYNAGMSAADNLARLAVGMVTGGGSTLTLGLAAMGSFGDTVRQISSQGGDPIQAVGMGIISGGLEVLTEKYSVDNILKVAKGDPLNFSKVLKEMLKQGAIEASEEEVNFLASTLAEAAIMQDKSSYNLQVKELMAQGLSEQEAREQANWSLVMEAGETAVQSFLSGMMITGTVSTANNAQYSRIGKKLGLGKVSMEDAKAIVDSGLESGTDTEAYQMALKLQKKIDAGKVPTKGELAQQLMANEQAIQGEQTTGEDANTGIKEQLKNNQKMLNRMEPVANITTPGNFAEMDLDAKKNWVIEKLRPTGYAVERKGFGIIDFAQKKLRAAFNYFKKGSAEEAAFEALPYVLEKGVEISTRENHKGRKYSTVTFAAPVTINGKRGNMAVVVRQTQGNQYKVHRVLLPDGSAFYIGETENEADSSTTRGVTDTGSLASSKETASTNIVDQGDGIVNTHDQNGGTENARTYEQADADGTGAGAGVLHGSSQRDAGTGAGKQTSGVVRSAEEAAQRTETRTGGSHIKAAIARENLAGSLKLPKVSARDIGLTKGTENRNLRVLPQEHWDGELQTLAQKAREETGKETVFVVGEIVVQGDDRKNHSIRAAITDTKVILQANYTKNPNVTLDQILDHEVYHYKRAFAGAQGFDLNEVNITTILDQLSEQEYVAVLDAYLEAMDGLYGLSEARQLSTDDLYNEIVARIREEMLADAYAGINAFGASADKFTKAVNTSMDMLNLGKKTAQENGVRQTNGPNENTVRMDGERYSLCEFEDGTRYVDVQMDAHTFDGMSVAEMNKTAKQILMQKFAGKVIGVENRVFVNGDSVNEYLHPSKAISADIRKAKLTASGELDNLLDAGRLLPNQPDGMDGHIHPEVTDFSYLQTIFKVGNEYFEGIVNIKNINRGKLLKDVTKIRNITKDIVSSYGTNPKSNFLRDASMDSIRDSGVDVNQKYLDAVSRGDLQTAQQMVDEAAKTAGYTQKAYHGTNANFNEFDWSETQRADAGFYGRGHYFATRKGEAEMYGKRVIPAALRNPNPFNFDQEMHTINGVYLRNSQTSNVLTDGISFAINMAQKFPTIFGRKTFSAFDTFTYSTVDLRWDELQKMLDDFMSSSDFRIVQFDDGHFEWFYEKPGHWRSMYTHNDYKSKADAENDKIGAAIGILFNEIYSINVPLDPAAYYLGGDMDASNSFSEELRKRGYTGIIQSENGDEIVIFDSENIKDASPVTYDDKGEVIPLSERFNVTSRDIRYSVDDSAYMETIERDDLESAHQTDGTHENTVRMDGEWYSAVEDHNKPITEQDIAALRSIGRKSVNAFTGEDLQKAQKWAHKFYQEMGTKSPFFRAWFGEWRENSDAAVTTVTENPSAKLVNGRAKNRDVGIEMSWNAHDVIRETGIHAARERVSVSAVNQLQEIVENAILLDTVVSMPTSNSKMQNTAFMHSFYSVYKTGDAIHVIKLYAEMALSNKGDAIFTRAYQLKDIKKIAVLGDGVLEGEPSLSGANTATINSISDLIDVVKRYDPEYKPNPPSKVVNADGTPMVVYHGSPAQFTIFDKKKAKYSGLYGRGFYFTNSNSHAATYGNLYSVYLNIRNPLQDGRDTVTRAQVRAYLEAVAENEDYSIENYGTYDVDTVLANVMGRANSIDAYQLIGNVNATAIGDLVEATELFNQVNGTKFDGIVVPTETVAFYPNQIKSAADNIGTFDAGNPDIRYSVDDSEGTEEWKPKTDAEYLMDEEEFRRIRSEVESKDKQWRDNFLYNQLGEEGAARYKATQKAIADREKAERAKRAKESRTASEEVKLDVESRATEAKRLLENKLLKTFSIPDGMRGELRAYIGGFADRIVKHGALTEDDRRRFFARMYEAGAVTIPADDHYGEARSYIKGGHIYVPDRVVAEFGDDWQDIRRRAFTAGIYLTRERTDKNGYSISGIDVWNGDLAAELPGLFDTEETDEGMILRKIIHVAEQGKEEKISLAEYVARVARDEYTSEDDVLDSLERQMRWALESFAETAQVEIQLKDRSMRRILKERQENKERAMRAKERQELRELQQKTLKSLQWLAKNRRLAPEELREEWDRALSDIDLYAVGAANEMNWSNKYQATWKDLAQMYKDARAKDPNFHQDAEIERIISRLDDQKIADMDPAALMDLYKLATGLRTAFYNRNNVLNDQQHRIFEEVYADSKEELTEAGKRKESIVDRLLNREQLSAMNVLERMAGWNPDSAWYSMAKQLERGERDVRAFTVKANRILEKFLTEHKDWVMRADGQGKDAIWYTIEVPELTEWGKGNKPIFGDTVTVYMTPAQKVHMYLESKNLDNLRHMEGGRTFIVDRELYGKGKRQEALAQGRTIRLAPETVKQLVSDLTPEEMELATILDSYYNGFATGEINRVSNVLYGYDKAMGAHYAPIYTNQNYTNAEFGMFDVTAEGVGNLKGRVQYSKNPSYNISAFDAFERNVNQTARFVGMAIPIRNWTTLMNWMEYKNSMKDTITHAWGLEHKEYIDNLLTDLQGGKLDREDVISETGEKLMSNYISAVFGANISIVLKQLGSIPLAGAYLGVGNVVPGQAQVQRLDHGLISLYTQDLAWRGMGYSMPETKQLKDHPNWTQNNKAVRFALGGGAITAMDQWAASVLWPWAENKVRKEYPDLEVGTQEQVNAGDSPFYKKVAEEFENAVARSQSTSDQMHQGTLRKSKHTLTRMFTMFTSDSAQTYNTLRQMMGEAGYYKKTGQTQRFKKMRKAAGAAVVALLLNALWGEGVNLLAALIRNKGKKYRDEEGEMTALSVLQQMSMGFVTSLSGTVIGGDTLTEMIGAKLLGEKFYTPESMEVSLIQDMYTTMETALDIIFGTMGDMADVIAEGGNLGMYIQQNGNDFLGKIKEAALEISSYWGIPAANVEAYIVGVLKFIPGFGSVYDGLFESADKNALGGLAGENLTIRVGSLLDRYGVDASDETADALAELYEAGHTAAVPSEVPSKVSIDGEEHTLNIGQQQLYRQVWSDVVADALDEVVSSERFAEASPEIREGMLKKLYSYASEQAKAAMFDDYEPGNTKENIAAYEQAGLDVADYLAVKAEGHNTDKYLEAVMHGLPEDNADDLMEEIAELEPVDGADEVVDVQKWRTCVDAFGVPMYQLAALASYMTDAQFKKAKAADDFGVDLSNFVRLYEIRAEYDESGNKSYSNAEYKKAIDSLGLSTQDSAVLWQLFTGSKSAKNNPYSSTVGQKVIDAIAD